MVWNHVVFWILDLGSFGIQLGFLGYWVILRTEQLTIQMYLHGVSSTRAVLLNFNTSSFTPEARRFTDELISRFPA